MKKFIYSLLILTALILTSCATEVIQYRDTCHYTQENQLLREEENINGMFPDKILVKTKTQTFNSYYAFQLHEGRIYYKGLEGQKPEEWTVLKRTGLPENFFERGFENPERITAISADANLLVALSDKGFFYYMMCTRELTASPFTWIQKKGYPQPMPLKLDAYSGNIRDWSMGRRGDEVLWYEDISGNQHHYGTMGIQHNYLLLEGGQEILFSDTGLPADFSHNILGPERGRFIAQSISASGTTLFLINKAGEMYSRLVDYDSLGSDPMFYKYTYDQSYRDLRPGSDYATNFNYWVLPSEEWLKQPEISLTGQAALTDRITILQNGEGNEARELRVAGCDPEGRAGYYFKQIYDKVWQFHPAPLQLEKHYLPESTEELKASLRGISPDRDLQGTLWSDNKLEEDIQLCLTGFNIQEGSCRLQVTIGSEQMTLPFYPVEMWYYMKRDQPGRDGTFKLMFGTMSINQFQLSRYTDIFQKKINRYFSSFDNETFAFTMEATENYVRVESADTGRPPLRMVFSENPEDLKRDPEILRRVRLMENDRLVQIYLSDELTVKNPDQISMKEMAILEEKLDRNLSYLEDVKEALRELEGRSISTHISTISYSGLEFFWEITGIERVNFPKINTITRHFDVILNTIRDSFRLSYTTKKQVYNSLINHVERRIEYYTSLMDPDAPDPPDYSESREDSFRWDFEI